ncbi:Beta-1,4-glucuronyltransferase 1 [Armadillidium nasatum]|uniref:Beta-1,4-glucuronyltransferase 1 n=1 Tax=Armadillidium nasatum TaxID=96803 RepID=A0A5N5SNI6_9CRUS|nr:Beta-1,4-glucuronyltransferase 1 [Armadillidium nasatum]
MFKLYNVPISEMKFGVSFVVKTMFSASLRLVIEIGTRTKSFKGWEPFYIGTNDEPIFDERLSSEGRANKMTQAYAMCLLGYEYHVLDNAFLVHKPGIKLPNQNYMRSNLVKIQKQLIYNIIVKEYKKYYGYRKECKVMT